MLLSFTFHRGKSYDGSCHVAHMILETSPWTHLLSDWLDCTGVINALVCLARFWTLLDGDPPLSFRHEFDFQGGKACIPFLSGRMHKAGNPSR